MAGKYFVSLYQETRDWGEDQDYPDIEHDTLLDKEHMTRDELVRQIGNGFSEPSCSPVCRNGHCWLNTPDPEHNYTTGEEIYYSLHIAGGNGKPVPGHHLKKLAAAAGYKLR